MTAALAPYQPLAIENEFARDVLDGLSHPHKNLPCKYFYDAAGSELFEQICQLDEYYLTRCETAILRRCLPEMAGRIGAQARIVEFGAGSGVKTELLLSGLENPAAYIPIDISASALAECARRLGERFPALTVKAIHADYMDNDLFARLEKHQPLTVFFPGSTLGNFDKAAAQAFLRRMGALTGKDGGILIGIDLMKDTRILLAAYDDKKGVTAAFNKNLLVRINRELDAYFDLQAFAHEAVVDTRKQRVEMHLVSLRTQTVQVAGASIRFAAGETIHTENSYKYTLPSFRLLAETSGLRIAQTWTDERQHYSLHYLKSA